MKVAVIFSTAFVVGLSGSMMPGPVTAVIIEQALKRGFRAGPLVTLGHGIMEAIMLGLLVAGAGRFLEGEGVVAGVIGLVGGAFLAWMGYGMVKGGWKGTLSLRGEGEGAERSRNPVWAGRLDHCLQPVLVYLVGHRGSRLRGPFSASRGRRHPGFFRRAHPLGSGLVFPGGPGPGNGEKFFQRPDLQWDYPSFGFLSFGFGRLFLLDGS